MEVHQQQDLGAVVQRFAVDVQHQGSQRLSGVGALGRAARTGGAAGTLTFNQACTGGTGWQYDDANNPTRVLLCNGTCDGVKAKAGKVDILFGCATQTGPVK